MTGSECWEYPVYMAGRLKKEFSCKILYDLATVATIVLIALYIPYIYFFSSWQMWGIFL